jgi:hypothetical protein
MGLEILDFDFEKRQEKKKLTHKLEAEMPPY